LDVVVCVKHIPDPNLPGDLEDGRLRRAGVQGTLDPGDEFGIEAGLQLKESGGGEVTLVSMGPEPAREAVRKGLSMGADKAVLIGDERLAGADALVTARALAAAIRRLPFDLVIAGVESTDGYTGTMPATLAELLGVPQVTFARRIEVSGDHLEVQRQTADGYHVVHAPLPALLTVTAGINEPRYPSFKGIMAAKKKQLDELTVTDLGLSDDELTVRQRVVDVTPAEERKAGRVVTDEGDAAATIADFLAEVKII
jgi:electron transfer flavoprotein beta subunit